MWLECEYESYFKDLSAYKKVRKDEMVKLKQNEILQYYRKKAKITQKVMAEKTGLSKNYISAMERGINKCNGHTLLVYIKECNIPLEAFF